MESFDEAKAVSGSLIKVSPHFRPNHFYSVLNLFPFSDMCLPNTIINLRKL